MKRVLTLATTGLFLSGLVLLPLSARADMAAAGAKDGKPVAASTTSGMPASSGTAVKPAVVKKAESPKVTAAPAAGSTSTVAPASGMPAKAPAKSGS